MTNPTFPSSLPDDLKAKYRAVKDILRRQERLAVAFSGGVDSALLLAMAVETLDRENVLAVTAVGLLHPEHETEAARRLALDLELEFVELDLRNLDDPRILRNGPDRCYWCKKHVFTLVRQTAERRGISVVASGSNADDTADYRPGRKAEDELGILRPFLEAGLSKEEIRTISRDMNLPTAEKPSAACLASRVPYGRALSAELLGRIEQAENALHGMGFAQCRLRDHDTVARIELPVSDLSRALELRAAIVAAVRDAGYAYVALDLEGFRSGAMNETLTPSERTSS
jgi:uncharacterized protein